MRSTSCTISDLGSTHGTFANTLPVHRHVLLRTDFVQVGATSLVFLRDAKPLAERVLELARLVPMFSIRSHRQEFRDRQLGA